MLIRVHHANIKLVLVALRERVSKRFSLGNQKKESGAASVELALVGPMFFLLLLAIFDISVMSFRDSTLHAALEAGARAIRTGQVAQAVDPEIAFVTAVCSEAKEITCGDITYDVRAYSNFGSVSFAPLVRDANGKPTGTQFTSGTSDGVIAIRLMIPHQFSTPYLTEAFAGQSQKLYLESTIIVRGEPWN